METHMAEIYVDGILLDAFELESAGIPGTELEADIGDQVRKLFERRHGEPMTPEASIWWQAPSFEGEV